MLIPVLTTIAVSPAIGQDSWMKDIFGDKNQERPVNKSPIVHDANRPVEVLISRRNLANIDTAISQYRRFANEKLDAIPSGRRLREGDSGDRVLALVRRLAVFGDLPSELASRNRGTFDQSLQAALRRFQARNGLTATGRLNSYTRAALNVSPQHRIDQLTANRRRIENLLSSTEGQRYVLVNIPAYELQAVNGGRVEVFSRVVLGKPSTPTPVLSAKIRALNTMPYWHVPQSIARRQLIPAIKKDPDYLNKQQIRVFASWGGEEVDPRSVNWWAPQGQRYVFRQDPGPQNALGLLRIDMPNKDIVYMHDTPLKKLYDYYLRPYSAGCVRVQTVFDVGEWLLRGDGYDAPGELKSLIGQRIKQTIKLKTPVDVHFAYISAWGTADGTVHFRPDIYELDAEPQQTAMAGGWKTTTTAVMP